MYLIHICTPSHNKNTLFSLCRPKYMVIFKNCFLNDKRNVNLKIIFIKKNEEKKLQKKTDLQTFFYNKKNRKSCQHCRFAELKHVSKKNLFEDISLQIARDNTAIFSANLRGSHSYIKSQTMLIIYGFLKIFF